MNRKIILSLVLMSIFIVGIASTASAVDIEVHWNGMPLDNQQSNSNFLDDADDNPNNVYIYFSPQGTYIDANDDDEQLGLTESLYSVIAKQSQDCNSNITTLKRELTKICKDYELNEPNITINSSYGEDMFITTSQTIGISMEPTIHNGDAVVLNKTHDIQVGDIVTANSSEYGPICKRVDKIKGNEVYLVSDNKNGTIIQNGKEYAYEGVHTWVNITDIDGKVIDILRNNGVIIV